MALTARPSTPVAAGPGQHPSQQCQHTSQQCCLVQDIMQHCQQHHNAKLVTCHAVPRKVFYMLVLCAGIDIHPMTLEVNFRLPFMREFLLLHGVVDASKTSCLMVLGKGSGQAILLAVGGAQEALYAQPGTYDLVSRYCTMPAKVPR
jgi:hypothetical protein